MRYKAAWLYEQGLPCGAEANMAKLLAADASWAAANACLDTHGGFGFAEEYDIERKFRETRLYQVAPVSTNLILAYIGQHVLGMPRSYYCLRDRIRSRGSRSATDRSLKSPAAYGSGEESQSSRSAQRPLQPLGVEVPADEDEPRAAVVVRPGVEVHGRMDDVLDGVDEQRPVAADVEQALDPQDLAAARVEQHRQPDPEAEPVDRPVERRGSPRRRRPRGGARRAGARRLRTTP